MWAWGWAAAALLWLQTAGAGARQELKKSRQLFARVDSPNITTSNREGFPGSVKVGRGWGVCRCAVLGSDWPPPRQLCSPISRLHCLWL